MLGGQAQPSSKETDTTQEKPVTIKCQQKVTDDLISVLFIHLFLLLFCSADPVQILCDRGVWRKRGVINIINF